MRKPTGKEVAKAREQVEELFLDKEWFELMKCWKGEGWHRSEVMAGIIVGLRIAENRNTRANRRREGG